ncbi:MAG TPA: phosphoglycerate dehydrogenase [Alphaproteobacteria bacterium]|nr:phosphoglycerate dehydrogenase [Alphaproteobacteria bacterium]
MLTTSLAKDKIKILLLEDLHANAENYFRKHGYNNIESLKGALGGQELIDKIKDVHIIGIRSRTKLTADVFAAAEKLIAVGCFCIGTNQVDLEAAKKHGVPVFNAPYSNTRSVAELVIGEIVMLMRGIPQRNAAAHAGQWLKNAKGSMELRGKVLGIVGYGHIGTQVSVMAEAMGMKVRYFDIVDKLAMGNAEACSSLSELLSVSDVVSLHVPQTAQTNNMFSHAEFFAMKKGAFFINAARGSVVDIDALKQALDEGQIAGAAIDVFPKEPATKDEEFVSPLRGMPNVILTPHIGGSTLEAQANIGLEVAERLVKYSDNGSTLGAVNCVEVSLPVQEPGKVTRFMHIHRNVPGVLSAINHVFSDAGLNVSGQYLRTDGEYAYVVVDVDGRLENAAEIRNKLEQINGTLKVRYLI